MKAGFCPLTLLEPLEFLIRHLTFLDQFRISIEFVHVRRIRFENFRQPESAAGKVCQSCQDACSLTLPGEVESAQIFTHFKIGIADKIGSISFVVELRRDALAVRVVVSYNAYPIAFAISNLQTFNGGVPWIHYVFALPATTVTQSPILYRSFIHSSGIPYRPQSAPRLNR